MNYDYIIIDEGYNELMKFELEEEALTFVEQYREYSYVRKLKPSIANLERLWSL